MVSNRGALAGARWQALRTLCAVTAMLAVGCSSEGVEGGALEPSPEAGALRTATTGAALPGLGLGLTPRPLGTPGPQGRHPSIAAPLDDPAARWSHIRGVMDGAGEEYRPRLGEGGWHLPHPVQGFVATLSEDRIALAADDAVGDLGGRWQSAGSPPAGSITLSLLRIGGEHGLSSAPGVQETRIDGNRVTLERGELREWYAMGPLGLEQGAVLDRPLPGSDDRVVLEYAVETDLELTTEGAGAVFTRDGAPVARAAEVYARDALGEVREGWLEAASDGTGSGVLRVVVDLAGMTYPVEIDPDFWWERPVIDAPILWTPLQGAAVAVEGNVALVGATGWGVNASPWVRHGAALVYTRSGTTWSLQATLTPADGAGGDEFGGAVALSGDTAVVGARYHDPAGATSQGAAYVYLRTGTTWAQQQKLLLADGLTQDEFGASVAIEGNVVVVGAPYDDVTLTNQGSAAVFTRSGATWTQEEKLVAPGAAASDYFGYSVAVRGDTVAVGAIFDEITSTNHGVVHVFRRSGTTSTSEAQLVPEPVTASIAMGYSVSLDGQRLVAGAPYENSSSGAAYAFSRTGTTWSTAQRLVPSNPGFNTYFGGSVSVSGGLAAIGKTAGLSQVSYVFAYSGTTWTEQGFNLTNGNVGLSGTTLVTGLGYTTDRAGAVSVFVQSGTTWPLQATFPALDGGYADDYGRSMAVSDTHALVAAAYDLGRRGSVYAFTRTGTDWDPLGQRLQASDGLADDYFGSAVTTQGNVALVGAEQDDVGANANQGSVYAFAKSGTTWSQTVRFSGSDSTANDYFGSAVALSGTTAVVGAQYENISTSNGAGAGYVFVQNGTLWTEQQKLAAADPLTGAHLGSAAAIEGTTLALGAPDPGNGAVYVFVRNGTVWSQQQKLTASDGAAGDTFGAAVAISGSTLVAGAPGDDIAAANGQGSVYAFTRTGTVWSEQQKLTYNPGTSLGMTVGVTGDMLAIGAEWNTPAKVYSRSGTVWSLYQDLVRVGGVAMSPQNLWVGTYHNSAGGPDGKVYPFILTAPLANGSSCPSGPSNCQSGICVDGVCCDAACTGSCLRCNGTTPGTCTSVTGATDADTCTGVNSCDAGGVCRKINGQSCTLATECASGFCQNGYCCNAACTDGCDVCNATPGTCTTIASGSAGASPSCSPYLCGGAAACPTSCASDANCATGYYCAADATCQPQRANGTSCNLAAYTSGGDCRSASCRECTSGNCVDGVCCDTACSASCDSCTAALKQTGTGTGTCGASAAGYIGSPLCASYACNGLQTNCATACTSDTHCQSTHYCSAAGTCVSRRSQGNACNYGTDCFGGAACRECTSGNCVDGYCCNSACGSACDVCSFALGAPANGTCGNAPATYGGSPSCAPFLCGGGASTCGTSCTADTQCAASAWCNTATGQCVADQANGATCTAASQCTSGNCVDGVCCNTACNGTCVACSAALKLSGTGSGTCDVVKDATDPHGTCSPSGGACGLDGLCNGAGQCRQTPAGTTCGSTVCTGNAVSGQVCDGAGACTTSGGTACDPYTCAGGACTNPCTGDGQCTAGNFCDAGVCRAKQANGLACSGPSACTSGNCVDGVCCNAPCNGACDACSVSAGATTNGTCAAVAASAPGSPACAPYLCNGSSAACPTSCSSDAGCDAGSYCSAAGQCVARRAQGQSCNLSAGQTCLQSGCRACQSGNCVDGFCCDSPCSGSCNTCSSTPGTCTLVPTGGAGSPSCAPDVCPGTGPTCNSGCANDASCAAGGFCDGTACQVDLPTGAACDRTAQCQSGFCVDGVCCATACTGTCQACSAALKQSGTGDGLCDVVKDATDPHDSCAVGGGACSYDGLCNGAGQCRLTPAGATCGSTVCVGNAVSGQVCDGAGACTTSGGTACDPYTCAGGSCSSPCSADAQCVTGYFCDAGACRAKQVNGLACGAGNACQSGYCVDGVCCDAPCGGACDACAVSAGATADGTCTAVAAGSSGNASCAPYVCNGSSAACPATCSGDGDCDAGAFCDSTGRCTPRRAQGQSCDLAAGAMCLVAGCRACTTGSCVDGFCCDSACAGSCNTCSSTPGTCTLVPAGGAGAPACAPDVCSGSSTSCNSGCTNDDGCAAAGFCDGAGCQSDLPQGGACDRAEQCQSGFCVDGVCCNSACAGTCQACSAQQKGSGQDGVCGNAGNGRDPHGDCSADAASSCQQDGQCDGNGACRLYVLGTACGSTVCSGNQVSGQICDGAGTCTTSTGGTACAPYQCAGGACTTPCATAADCVAGNWCDAGTCRPLLAGGAVCPGGSACQSGFCADGVCCDAPCDGACAACSVAAGASADGTCTTVSAGTVAASCGNYVCNGSSQSCPTTCSSDAQCGGGAYCSAAGQCVPQKGQGQACNVGAGSDCLVSGCRACATGQCVDGYCCDAPCGEACDTCSLTPGTCTVAVAGAAGTPSCAPGACDGSSATCGTTCVSDIDCAAAGYCTSGGQCTADGPIGAACTRAEQCASGHCVDGVCCDTACTGNCQACAAALKESGNGDGACGNAAAGRDPHADCSADLQATCQQDGQCDGAGRCRLYQPGTGCGAGNTCDGNVVRGQICDGFGSCTNDANGLDCSPYLCRGTACTSPCALDSDCAVGNFCAAGTCTARLGNGAACTAGSACASGFCVDGVCCDTACTGTCEACAASLQEGTGADGACGPAAAGTDPHDTCTDDGAPSCDRDGTCDGARQCRVYAAGATCGPDQCTGSAANGFAVTAYTCDGAGTCNGADTSCGQATCAAAACLTGCVDSTECIASAYCAQGTCTPRLPGGQACSLGDECASGYCVDGLCCDGLCQGQCEACDVAGALGRCTPVVGAPHGARTACAAGDVQNPCSAAECDGSVRNACAAFVANVSCRAASCTAGTATLAASCNGTGQCPPAQTSECGAYACAGAACGTSCTAVADCNGGFRCDAATSTCVPADAAVCDPDGVTLRPPTGDPVSCAPYRCEGTACIDTCSGTEDCVSGYVCDPGSRACIQPTGGGAAAADDGGCGCRTAGRAPAGTALGAWGLVLAALGAAARRGRR